MRGCNVCIALKAVRHKAYDDLQSLPVPTHRWKDLSIDFVTGLPISIDWKGDSYDSILVIVNRLTKMVHYKPVKVTIDAPGFIEVIIDVVVRYHGLADSIITDQKSLFTSKFWLLLCYFLGIKHRLFTAFHPRRTDRPKDRIVWWKSTFKFLLISNRIIGQGSYWWPSLPTITSRMQALAIPSSSSIADTILAFPMRKILIPAQNQEPQKNYPPSFKSWWPFASKIYTMHKSFKNRAMTRGSSRKAMQWVRKFG